MFKDVEFIYDKSYFIAEKFPFIFVLLVVLLIIIVTIFLVRKELKKL